MIDDNEGGGTAGAVRAAKDRFEAAQSALNASGDPAARGVALTEMRAARADYGASVDKQAVSLGETRATSQARANEAKAAEAQAGNIADPGACSEDAGNVVLGMDELVKRTENDAKVVDQAAQDAGYGDQFDTAIVEAGASIAGSIAASAGDKAYAAVGDQATSAEAWSREIDDHRDKAQDAAKDGDLAGAGVEAAEVDRLLTAIVDLRSQMSLERKEIADSMAVVDRTPGLNEQEKALDLGNLQAQLDEVDSIIAGMDGGDGTIAGARNKARQALTAAGLPYSPNAVPGSTPTPTTAP